MYLYYARQTCAMAIDILLEETGVPFQRRRLLFENNEQRSPEFLAINSKGKVPTLVIDSGEVITELPAIAYYLVVQYPAANLVPADNIGRVRAFEYLEYSVATMHMRGFSRVFRPELYAPAADHEWVKSEGFKIIGEGFKLFEAALLDKDYLIGQFSVADAGLFVLEWWYAKRLGLSLPSVLAKHFERMLSRASVQRMLEAENSPR